MKEGGSIILNIGMLNWNITKIIEGNTARKQMKERGYCMLKGRGLEFRKDGIGLI